MLWAFCSFDRLLYKKAKQGLHARFLPHLKQGQGGLGIIKIFKPYKCSCFSNQNHLMQQGNRTIVLYQILKTGTHSPHDY